MPCTCEEIVSVFTAFPAHCVQQSARRGGSTRARAVAEILARGLPPNGVEVLWSPVKRRVKTWEGEAGMAKRR